MQTKFRWLIAAFSIAALAIPAARAQVVSGSIEGTVTDASGAAVPNAAVVVTNGATGVEFSTATNGAGHYIAGNLIAGNYGIKITANGFRPISQENVQVDIGAVVRVDLRLEVGNVQEQVNVTAQAPLLQSDSAQTGQTIGTKQLDSLPAEGRNPTALSIILPGVIQNTGQQGIPGAQTSANYSFSANGQRSQLNQQLLDGVDDTEGVGGGALIVPSTDALQEFTVATSNYDVEFGAVAGAVQLMTTKSGTNELHGSAYESNRVNALFARNPFSEPNGPGHFVWNQFGGTLGGPVKKNKIFLFGWYEGTRVRSGGNVLTTVPIAPFRNGDFSSLPDHPIFDPESGSAGGVGRVQFPNNVIPSNRLDPISQKLINSLPQPNLPGTDNNFITPQINPINQDIGTIRADYAINDASRVFVRYTRRNAGQSSNAPAYGKIGSFGSSISEGNNNSAVADYSRVITPSLVVEGRFGWMLNEWKQDAVDQSSNTSAEFGIPGLNDACSSCGGLAGFIIGGPVSAFSFGNSAHAHQVDNLGSYNFVGLATWTHGQHTFKFGEDTLLPWRDRRDTSSQGNFGCDNSGVCDGNGFSQSITGSADVNGSGLSIASFLLGDASTFGRVVYANNLPLAHQTRTAPYIQDTWRVTPKLTLTLGLRWDFIGYPTSPQKGGIANFNFTNAKTIISDYGDTTATANVKNNFGDWGPRIGIAYRLFENTVIRAGYARSYSIGFYGANFGAITNDWPSASRQKVVQPDPYTPALTLEQGPPPFVSGYQVLAAAGNPGQYPTPSDSAAFGTDPHNPDNSVDQWNLTVQHQFANDFTVSGAYVGNAVRHMFYRLDYNVAPPGPGPFNPRRRYDSFGFDLNAYNQSNQSSTGYHSMQLNAQKRFSKGLLFTTAFTWSKSYDFGTHNPMDMLNQNIDRAVQDSDRQFVFTASHVWELPIGPGKRWLNSGGPAKYVLGGWQISGIWTIESGLPFTPTLGDSASLNSDCCTLRPNLIGDPNISNQNRNLWFNPTAFAVPVQYQFGNSGRNILRGPGFFHTDLSLLKGFQFTEKTRLELSMEAFNVFNHTNLGNPNGTVDSSTAGQIFGTSDIMRRLQLGVNLRF